MTPTKKNFVQNKRMNATHLFKEKNGWNAVMIQYALLHPTDTNNTVASYKTLFSSARREKKIKRRGTRATKVLPITAIKGTNETNMLLKLLNRDQR